MADFEHYLFDNDLAALDPLMDGWIAKETERQARRLILIPSESICMAPVRKVLDTPFSNLYAEGYPPSGYKRLSEEELADEAFNLVFYRRYADRRFYKGNDYVNLVEQLAARRVADCFANPHASSKEIFANVQTLSGSAANLAIYDAFVKPGDTVMSLDLMQGGHLSHGSPFHVTGKSHKIIPFGVDPKTELLDYDQIRDLAKTHRPKMLIGGFTSYPWAPKWDILRSICDEVGATLMADVSHPAGLIVAGEYPNPVGIADVTVFTTHKTLCGPRGAVILTTDQDKAQAVDTAVFPGHQGGPHVNKIAALAVAFKLAQTEQFKALQRRIRANAQALAQSFQDEGLRLSYGGTDTHLLLLDLKSIAPKSKEPLRGEMAARILELCGIVVNKNTIPGDELTALATGIRMGTPWVSQRGMTEDGARRMGKAIADICKGIKPFHYEGLGGTLPRGKIDLDEFEAHKAEVDDIATGLAGQADQRTDFPLFNFPEKEVDGQRVFRLTGPRVEAHLQQLITGDLSELEEGKTLSSYMVERNGKVLDKVVIARVEARNDFRHGGFYLIPSAKAAHRVLLWLRGHAEGYVLFEDDDITAKIEGPVVVEEIPAQHLPDFLNDVKSPEGATVGLEIQEAYEKEPEKFALHKPYFIGQNRLADAGLTKADKTVFTWEEPKDDGLKRTALYEEHAKRTKKLVPFAGWEMPVWYTSLIEEHQAVRQGAGLFDVSHMGVFDVTGITASDFLDYVSTNYSRWFGVGESYYSYLLDQDANVLDDIMVYHLDHERFLVVVNAGNEPKDWTWMNKVLNDEVLTDRRVPTKRAPKATLRNLKDPSCGDDRLILLAFQGPKSLDVLCRLADDETSRRSLKNLPRTHVCKVNVAGLPLIVSRTGYTGENYGYELFVHPDNAAKLWNAILDEGKDDGVVPTGLGARDSLRTEAGLPLYGHELAGTYEMNPYGAGFGSYVKLHKPFFIGKDAIMKQEENRSRQTVRFAVPEGERPLRTGDLVTAVNGSVIGHVTSCVFLPDKSQVGLAYINIRNAKPGPVEIWPGGDKAKSPKKGDIWAMGDRLVVPVTAEIVSRFPAKK